MTTNAPPSGDPADDDSLAGTLRAAFRKFLQQTDDMLPARVIAFDRDKNRVTVAPCVTALTTDGRAIPRAQVASVPVFQLGGGGLVLHVNIKPGDLGWIKASDRDISNFLQSFGVAPPNTVRLHTFQDAMFFPDAMRGWTLAGDDAEAAVLQTLDGNSRASVSADRVKLAFGGNTAVVDASGVTLTAGGCSLAVTAAGVTIVGPVTQSGGMTSSGGMAVTGGATFDGVVFGAHSHTDPQGGNVGGPHN